MKKNQKKIYDSLPYPFKILLLNIKGYLNYKERYTNQFNIFYKEHLNLWNATPDTLSEYQKKRLGELLTEALLYSKWYKQKMKEAGVAYNLIQENPIKALNRMPILSKTDRKKNTDLIVNTNREITSIGYSSGTSGSPTKNYVDKESINRSFALWKRFHHAIGLKTKFKQVRFSGRILIDSDKTKPPFWVYNYFEKQLLMSSYHLKEENIKHYVNKLNKFKPELLDGYPSAIYIISKHINQNSLPLSFVPKAIAVTAETLYDYQRLEIEKAFKCAVYNQYASSEGSPFITECTKGNLHLNLDSGIFELITKEGNVAQPGELAQLVVTSFTNLKTPLIRYNIEDTVILPKKGIHCNCGCLMPVIEQITGREDDILWTKEKGYVGRMGPAFKGLDNIIKSQIIQPNATEIIVNIIVNSNFSEKEEKQLLNNLKDRLGKNIDYKINKVKNIPLGANGKYNTVKRNFKINLEKNK